MDVIINIIGGIALLLWGIRMVRTGITRTFGADLRRAMTFSASNRLMAFATGLGVTTAIQSSTATALILSSFAGRGFLAGSAALAIMLGADVGSTLVVQAMSFDLRWLSPVFIAVGVLVFLKSESSKRRSIARAIIGLGLMFLALHLIAVASVPLRENEALSVVLKPLTDELILAVLVSAVLTWAAHSSVAMVLFVMSLAAMQVLNVHVAMAMVLGANLGGGITAVVATLGASAAARRIPLGNLIMRGVGVVCVLAILPWVLPYLAMAGDEPARMIANFHTGFNILLALAFLPLVGPVYALTERLLPDEPATDDPGQPRYLDPVSLDSPDVALAAAAREALRLGDEARGMVARSLDVFQNNDGMLLKEIERADDTVDSLHEAIKLYLTRLTKEELDDVECQRSIEILLFTTNLEHIGDIVDKNLMELASKKIKKKLSFSAAGQDELIVFHERVMGNFDLALNIFMSGDAAMARRLIKDKSEIRDLERDLVERHFDRIGAGQQSSIETSALHVDVLRDLKRINSHLTSIAYPVIERAEAAAVNVLPQPTTRPNRSKMTAVPQNSCAPAVQ